MNAEKERNMKLQKFGLFIVIFIFALSAACTSAPTAAPAQPTAVVTEAPAQPTAVVTEAPAPTEVVETEAPVPTAEPTLDVIADLAEKAKSEEKVISSYGMPDAWANYGAIFGEFQKRYGNVPQDIDMGGPEAVTRMTSENAGLNDLADIRVGFAMQLADAGLTADYKVSCWDLWPDDQKGEGKDGSVWATTYRGTIGWIVNTNLVEKVPHTWAELNDPAYKGMISYLDPRVAAAGMSIVEAASYAMSSDPYNYQAGADYLAKLHNAGLVGIVDSRTDVSKFQRGEVGIMINWDYNLMNWQQTLGVPAEVVIPTDGSISSGYSVVIAKNAPQPYTARLFLEYLLCGDGQNLYAAGYVTPMNPNVKLPPEVAAIFPPAEEYAKVVSIDYAKEGEIADALKAAWATAVGAK
jgi:putative spermidine/putrescine transport system substrate-binding protein